MSAWFFPVLVPFAVVAMVVMGRERASWWAVPALWPATQWYYSLMAMPALTPITAAILAAPIQGAPAVGAIVAAFEVWYRRRRARLAAGRPAPTADGVPASAPRPRSHRVLSSLELPSWGRSRGRCARRPRRG